MPPYIGTDCGPNQECLILICCECLPGGIDSKDGGSLTWFGHWREVDLSRQALLAFHHQITVVECQLAWIERDYNARHLDDHRPWKCRFSAADNMCRANSSASGVTEQTARFRISSPPLYSDVNHILP
ncbi:hypothetical protein [Nocardia fluminea]|uniref:hypothetical protein n=1 Tax=Nocardia fluminea TaxID=134984 RepID=UPI0036677168